MLIPSPEGGSQWSQIVEQSTYVSDYCWLVSVRRRLRCRRMDDERGRTRLRRTTHSGGV